MASDISRQRFDPRKDFSGVLLQQGRVHLDAEFNEWVDMLDRRWRAQTVDTIGRAVVPTETADGFKIGIDPQKGITLGVGRMYVDGLLAENHGVARSDFDFDAVLGEPQVQGSGVPPAIYDELLPRRPTIKPTADAGSTLVYLEVWKREVTSIEDSDLLEVAVGVETANRLQTAWRLGALTGLPFDWDCAADLGTLKPWQAATRPSDGRLSTGTVEVDAADDPCILPPAGGYRGVENRLYRVQIHQGGKAGTATFKWSRENASVATAVTELGGSAVTVQSLGVDAARGFDLGDWVELTDDLREFAGRPGEMFRITAPPEQNRITLDRAIPADLIPAGGADDAAARHTRLIRWDQSGRVLDEARNVVIDLNNAANAADGIPVPASGGSVMLEDGVKVTFFTSEADGVYRGGDYWVFAARYETAAVETLDHAPPRGIHRHFAPLAVLKPGQDPIDCRQHWPPKFGGNGCDCTICVSEQSHRSGVFTLRDAIAKAVATPGAKVCVEAGTYAIDEPLHISGADQLQLVGHGWGTLIHYSGRGPAAIVVSGNSVGVTIERLSVFVGPARSEIGAPLNAPSVIAISNAFAVEVRQCVLYQTQFRDADPSKSPPAVALAGVVMDLKARDNVIVAPYGIGLGRVVGRDGPGGIAPDQEPRRLLTIGLLVEQNTLVCANSAIAFSSPVLHAGPTRVAHNFTYNTRQTAIQVAGLVLPNLPPEGSATLTSRVDIENNTVMARGTGVAVAGVDCRVVGNHINVLGNDAKPVGHGIVLEGAQPIERSHVLGNCVIGVQGMGILAGGDIRGVMIKQNFIDAVHDVGIGLVGRADRGAAHVEDNVIQSRLAGRLRGGIFAVGLADLSVANNSVSGLCGPQGTATVGVLVIHRGAARISGNSVSPFSGTVRGIGLLAADGFAHLDIGGNQFRQLLAVGGEIGQAEEWRPVQVGVERAVGPVPLFGLLPDAMKAHLDASLAAAPAAEPLRPTLSVRGNTSVHYSRAGLALSIGSVASNCTIADNHFSLRPATQGEPALASIQAFSVLMNANRFESPQPGAVVLHAKEALIMANVIRSRVVVNDADRTAALKDLNLFN